MEYDNVRVVYRKRVEGVAELCCSFLILLIALLYTCKISVE